MDAAQDHGKAHSAQHEFWHHLSAGGRERDLCGSFCRRRIHEAGTSLLMGKKYYRKIQVPSPALLKVSVTRLYISVANNSRGWRAPREPTLTKIIVPLQPLDLTAVFGKTEGRHHGSTSARCGSMNGEPHRVTNVGPGSAIFRHSTPLHKSTAVGRSGQEAFSNRYSSTNFTSFTRSGPSGDKIKESTLGTDIT